MPDAQDPKQVTNNNLPNSQFGGGFINAENVNAGRIGGDIVNNYNYYNEQPNQRIEIDWHQVSPSLLDEHLRLTTNPLTMGEEITYRTEQVYVPLGLVERKRQSRRKEDVSPEKGSELYHETEIKQTFEPQQFLEQVLRNRQSPQSQGKRIAIIGEPGTGKTTLLQQIAQWVSKEIEQSIVIWVSLAELRSHELETYLLEVWLQAVARKAGHAEASNQLKDDFVTQFNQGLVWLMLDGVDEMQTQESNPLEEIERQIRMGALLRDYVYLRQNKQERRPSSGNFASGEFTKLFQKVRETVDLIFADGIDWQAFLVSLQELKNNYGDENLSVQAIEKKSNSAFIIRLEVSSGIDKCEVERQAKELYGEKKAPDA